MAGSKTAYRKSARRACPSPSGGVMVDLTQQQTRLERVYIAVLLLAGVYLSIIYFGHQIVPNSDFPAFVQSGDAILHFRMPVDFKRVPMLGIMQIAVSKLMFASPHPIFTGGLVLNAILYVLGIVLFYRLARLFIGPTGSFCVCLFGAINPYTLALVVHPIAETAIVFFVLLTLYLILRGSWWCYAAGMLASMTRYECFGLIIIALLFDLFRRRGKRQKLPAVGAAFAAAVPMILWMVGTKMTAKGVQSSYFHHFLDVDHRNGFAFIKMLWQTSFAPLLQWPEWVRAVLVERPVSQAAAEAIQSHQASFQQGWYVLAGLFFVLGIVGVTVRREWKFLCVLLFWLGYVSIHMAQRVLLDRYTVPVIWLTLLIAAYGLSFSARWAAAHIPRAICATGAAIAAVVSLFWIFYLLPAIGKTAQISSASATAAWAGCTVIIIGLAAKQYLYRCKSVFWDGCLVLVLTAMVFSNQFPLAFRLGQGDTDIEFRRLAEWYNENAGEDERLVTTMKGVVDIFAPGKKHLTVHTSGVSGQNLEEFAEQCRERQLTYVAWDSRLGLVPQDEYYRNWGLQKIHALGGGKNVGLFTLIRKFEGSSRRYIYLYRVNPGQQ